MVVSQQSRYLKIFILILRPGQFCPTGRQKFCIIDIKQPITPQGISKLSFCSLPLLSGDIQIFLILSISYELCKKVDRNQARNHYACGPDFLPPGRPGMGLPAASPYGVGVGHSRLIDWMVIT